MTDELIGDDEIQQRLSGSAWEREGDEIVRNAQYDDFAAALAALNRVAVVAERHNHHPDLLLHGWNKLQLRLTNHAAGGLTAKDFEVAAEVDTALDS